MCVTRIPINNNGSNIDSINVQRVFSASFGQSPVPMSPSMISDESIIQKEDTMIIHELPLNKAIKNEFTSICQKHVKYLQIFW